MMKKVHLICNAHIDPVWLWEWEEGAAEAISTFRVAADFCEEYDGFIFNHNEAILYKWVEEYEPELFKRIQRLVKKGRWDIMGGWYLQPDCNMPSGESFVRQILIGRQYFQEKFNISPTTAINFDPFGHTRGLVQILKKSGYDSYLFCRPFEEDCYLPNSDFVWVGYDGSEVIGHRAYKHYLTARGEAHKKIESWMGDNKYKSLGLILWGIGNHGGGPSREDIMNITQLIDKTKEYIIIHSKPEAYFEELRQQNYDLPQHKADLNAWAVGCYTSQIRVKQKHRQLENELFITEKMLVNAAVQSGLQYPGKELREAVYDLLTAEFHDTLPGSSIQPVEEGALRQIEHGLEILSRLKARAFFALARSQKKAENGQYPVLVYNPHPYPVKKIIECEFNLADQNWEQEYSLPIVYQNGKRIVCQTEKEVSNMMLDWRKRIVFEAELQPCSMNRFNCKIEKLLQKPKIYLHKQENKYIFKTSELQVFINCQTGLIDKYAVNGIDILKERAMQPIVIQDNEDPWGMRVKSFRNISGIFKLMDLDEGSIFSGIHTKLIDSVRVIEDGDIRTVIEAVMVYEDSKICQRYKLPKRGTEIEVEVRVFWNEKDKMLKLSIPTYLENASYLGQVAYGVEKLDNEGNEVVAQKWTALFSEQDQLSFTCINDGIYGSDCKDNEIRLSLLRSPAYAAHPIKDRQIMPSDRFSPRIDQGERVYYFWFNAGNLHERKEKIEREAQVHNEKPFALSFFPSGTGDNHESLVKINDETIVVTCLKKAENGNEYIIRMFEPTGQTRSTTISIPLINLQKEINFSPFEIKTFKINFQTKILCEENLIE